MKFSIPVEERLIRFPNVWLQTFEFRVIQDGEFDKARFFETLFQTRTFHGNFVGPDFQGARPPEEPDAEREASHGPFSIDKMQPSHYVETDLEEAASEIRSRVDTAPRADDDLVSGWFFAPHPPTAGRRLESFLEQFSDTDLRCFKLSLTVLEGGDDTFSEYFSEFHKKTGGILWHFEEWVTYDAIAAETRLFFLGYD